MECTLALTIVSIMNSGLGRTVGERVKRLREAHGMSQRQLAARAEVGSGYLSLLEKNSRNPKRETLERLAEALRVPEQVLDGLMQPRISLEKLDRARINARISVERLAEAAGVNRAHLWAVQSDDIPGSFALALRLAPVLRTKAGDLLEDFAAVRVELKDPSGEAFYMPEGFPLDTDPASVDWFGWESVRFGIVPDVQLHLQSAKEEEEISTDAEEAPDELEEIYASLLTIKRLRPEAVATIRQMIAGYMHQIEAAGEEEGNAIQRRRQAKSRGESYLQIPPPPERSSG